jgi:hypothetical protein
MFRFCAMLLALLLLATGPSLAKGVTATFTPTDVEFPNPERGWWVFAPGAAEANADARMASIAKNGHRVVLSIIRLDDYRGGSIPASYLSRIENLFALARKHGLKMMVRVAYNYPTSSDAMAAARDAPLDVVLSHIKQIAPIIAANSDTVVVLQAGFIGLWGEGHSSNNNLTTPENKRKVRDALYAAMPQSVPIVWRYPADIMRWTDDTTTGMHNDCFLSSPTDVGTYSGDLKVRLGQRAAMEKRTSYTYFAGETCSAGEGKPPGQGGRYACADILAEGAQFHLSALNRNYYPKFHDGWIAQGCFDEVTRSMGYRLELVQFRTGKHGSVILDIKNNGWARPVQARAIVVTTFGNGQMRERVTLKGDLTSAEPGATASFTGELPSAKKATRICVSAPDSSKRMADFPVYAVRFANADADGQVWDAKLGAFCFDISRRKRQS